MRKWLVVSCLIMLLLCSGCGKDEVPESEPIAVDPTYLHTPTNSYDWDGISFDSLFPATSYEESGDTLNIFPCYEKDSYISIRKILISSNGFWDNVVTQYSGTSNIKNFENYSYVTNDSGETYGYLPVDDNYAYIVSTSTLPSGYVDNVLSYLYRTKVYK